MNRFGWLLVPAVLASCAKLQQPPAQVVEPLPTIADAPGSASASPGPADMPGADGKAVETPISAPAEAFQPVSGTLDGKPFELKGAGTAGPIRADGNVQVTLANYSIDCGHHAATPEDRTITITIPWKAKTRLDLSALAAKETSATAFDEKKKKPMPIRSWKPKGTVDVLTAPTRAKSSARIKIELTNGKDTSLTAEIPVRLCYVN